MIMTVFPVALIIKPTDPPTRDCQVKKWGCTVSFIVKKTKGGGGKLYVNNGHNIIVNFMYIA